MKAGTKSHTDNDLYPDAWKRFERAIDAVVKSPPQHRKPKAITKRKKVTKKRR
jgi:hypothetical protein